VGRGKKCVQAVGEGSAVMFTANQNVAGNRQTSSRNQHSVRYNRVFTVVAHVQPTRSVSSSCRQAVGSVRDRRPPAPARRGSAAGMRHACATVRVANAMR